ncbi:peptidase M24 [Dendrothele bispora CBS 962.96]|uniref:Peptidase M24 n=1 Tax=Dendrothele bispora (strain CBS 962.96) TaxID=1314807 RepID=A0A4S8MDE1_DENBC|nr:peptidase M24 [Dendrothele bispora CBS 962.96]
MNIILRRRRPNVVSRFLLSLPPSSSLSTTTRRLYATETQSQSSSLSCIKPTLYGQPTFQSHPHLVKPEELTPGFPPEEYESRRKALMDSLPDNSVVVSIGGTVKYMSGKIFYKFRQASDFWYLTGFEEPDSALILEKTSSSRGFRMTLFTPGSDPSKAQWDGASTSHTDICSLFSSDDARPIDHFPSHLRASLFNYTNIYVDMPPSRTRRGYRSPTTKSLLRYLNLGLGGGEGGGGGGGGNGGGTRGVFAETDSIIEGINRARRMPLAPEISRLRAVKSEREQNVMKQAAEMSGRAHAKTMRFTRPGLSEQALGAHFEYICSLSGAQRLAYVPVVASGPNSLIIHYTSNNQIIEDGEMILIDAGCEYNGYASDITRTFPSNGTFSPPQRDLYSAVLAAQKQLVAYCYEGWEGNNLYELHRRSRDLLVSELRQIGIDLRGGAIDRLYPHFLSHPIGIDLHESDSTSRSQPLKSGMVITIEPGIYVPPIPEFPSAFHGLGVRIEDEVLVGKGEGTEVVLSGTAPKEIADVEGACQGLLGFEPY